ncbi:MogA/MoaB family molybdenum cofactor biosynthesis protein [Halarchaeum acidiphilum]|uniref:MogA/MoaB family molybdenum cofactor biosynthesis protein n=1 Tax=Halarchaeum acidiphilum TaxID=489138 RepID=UPI00036DA776|nr:MogA/MoaB family molybdenum cofactor biosynthesis protein [Halarchaeum acidiphilum]
MVDFQSRDTDRASDAIGEGDAESGSDDEREGHAHGEHDHGGESHDHDDEHDHHARDVESVAFGVVTVSSSRSADDDPSGDAIARLVAEAGHDVTVRDLVGDDFDDVQGTVDRLVRRDDVEAVVTTGGTGVTPDDVTVEAVEPLWDKRLPGFGELFRRLSADEIATRAIATRATAGVASGVPVFCLPGSESAVRLGVDEVILPEIGHLVGLARRPAEGNEAADGTDDAGDGDGEAGDGGTSGPATDGSD